jgi:GNAT superfamily N-acetyltransferase
MTGRLGQLLQRPEYITFVAETCHEVVGMVGVHMAYGYELNGLYGRLTGLVVDELFRGQGVGRQLIEAAEAWIRQQGISSVIVTSGSQRTDAHRFYQDLGFTETGKRFAKQLE